MKTNSIGQAVGTSYFGMIAAINSAKKQSQASLRDVVRSSRPFWDLPRQCRCLLEAKGPPELLRELLEGGGFALPALYLHSSCLLPVILLLGARYSHHHISPQVVSQEAQEPANAFMNEPIWYLLCFLPNYNETTGRRADPLTRLILSFPIAAPN